jgi:hypothetical protein
MDLRVKHTDVLTYPGWDIAIVFVVCFRGAGDGSQDLAHARQMLYQPSSFFLKLS